MNNKLITGIVLAVLVLTGVGVIALSQQNNDGAYTADRSEEKPADRSEVKHDHPNGSHEVSTGEVQEADEVIYQDFSVAQPHIKVKKGTTVTWVNKDTAKHDVTPVNETDEFEASKLFGKGETYQVTFNTVGTYEYYCSPHPYMKGVVEVVE